VEGRGYHWWWPSHFVYKQNEDLFIACSLVLVLLLVEVSYGNFYLIETCIIMSSSIYRFGSAIYIVYIAFRASIANLSPITDCDEVYNYWEPLHFILYGT